MDQERVYGGQRDREGIRLGSLSWQVDEDCICGAEDEMVQGINPRICMPTFVIFVRDGPFLGLDELVPFICSLFV